VSKYRNVFANEKIGREKFDPRFDERSGPYDEYIYRKNYEFLDGMRQKEEKILAKEIKKTKQTDPESAEKMKEVLRRMKNHDKSIAEKERNKEVIRELRRENNERMRQGKRPIYLTKGELKMRMMEKKFEELKKTHKLDSYIERKSKKHNLKGNAKPF
ncbi:unnamed protein product, partial [Anisakis simplex]|uniref:rRNA biogenesis protein RRP36 n=1 Tax=Anisakis simplex TaxID=6269 RepID=A0A0M3KHQ8_ANISI